MDILNYRSNGVFKYSNFTFYVGITKLFYFLWLTAAILLITIFSVSVTLNIFYASIKVNNNNVYDYLFFIFYFNFLWNVTFSLIKTYLRTIFTIMKVKPKNQDNDILYKRFILEISGREIKYLNSTIIIPVLLIIFLIIICYANKNGLIKTFSKTCFYYVLGGIVMLFVLNYFSKIICYFKMFEKMNRININNNNNEMTPYLYRVYSVNNGIKTNVSIKYYILYAFAIFFVIFMGIFLNKWILIMIIAIKFIKHLFYLTNFNNETIEFYKEKSITIGIIKFLNYFLLIFFVMIKMNMKKDDNKINETVFLFFIIFIYDIAYFPIIRNVNLKKIFITICIYLGFVSFIGIF